MKSLSESHVFTLVELLVVVSIISLLLAILMPMWGKVRKQAKRVVCQNNLRQLGLGFEIYMHDYNGIPPEIHKSVGVVFGEGLSALTALNIIADPKGFLVSRGQKQPESTECH